MSRRVAIWLWLAFAFVTWNVVFDRQVSTAAIEFTREQITRYERGEATARLDEVFRPRVRRAALIASLYAGGVLACGAVVIRLSRVSKQNHSK